MSDRAQTYLEDYLAKQTKRLEQVAKSEKAKCPLAYYVPHEKQAKFHGAADFKFRYVRTGNRWGKTTAGAAEDLAFAYGCRPWIPEGDPARTVGIPERSVTGLLIVADWDQAEKIFTSTAKGQGMGKFFKLGGLPGEGIIEGYKNNAGGKIEKIFVKSIHGGTSTIYIDTIESYKRNPMGHESSDWDFVHLDEPCPKPLWEANIRGLVDRGGKGWVLCTPITEMWINDWFITDPAKTRKNFDKEAFETKNKFGSKFSWTITGSIHDNVHLKDEDKDDFFSTLSDEDREARELGFPRALTGVIYKEFDHDKHVYYEDPIGWGEGMHDVPEDWTIRLAIDVHPRKPQTVLFAATAPDGHVYFYAEIFRQMFGDELGDSILEVLNGRVPYRVLLEQAAWVPSSVNGQIMADALSEKGLGVEKATKELSHGILKTRERLRSIDPATGAPWLHFSAELRRTIWEFGRYVWKKDEEKPLDVGEDHMMECLYRLVLTGLEYVPPDIGSVSSPHKIEVGKRLNLTMPFAQRPRPVMLPSGQDDYGNAYGPTYARTKSNFDRIYPRA